MKKIAIILFVAATALAACGKKKAPENPEPAAGSAEAGSGSDTGSAGSGSAM